jgi:hypothetical protein
VALRRSIRERTLTKEQFVHIHAVIHVASGEPVSDDFGLPCEYFNRDVAIRTADGCRDHYGEDFLVEANGHVIHRATA